MTSPKYDIVRLHRDDPRSWALMPLALDRLRTFCQSIDVDTPIEEIVDLVRSMFAAGDYRLGFWVCVEDDVRLVAHLLAFPEPLYSDTFRYVLVRQAQVDEAVDLRREAVAVFDAVKYWAKSLGLGRIMALTHRNEQVMARRWGLKPYKALLLLDLGED